MKDGGQKLGRSNGLIRSFSTYLKIVSSGASSVASTVRSAGASVASSIVDRNDDTCSDQVRWAGFDKLEYKDSARQVLLLAYQSGFQVWDVEEADDVHELVSRHDGPVSSLQVQQKPLASKKLEDKFLDVRPLLVVAGDAVLSGGGRVQDDVAAHCSGNVSSSHEQGNDSFMPTVVRFYSLRSQSYVHVLKFRSAVYSVRCSSRIVAISQEAQIHCFNAITLEREYTILTYPIVSGPLGSGSIGCGPLAVGPRWLAHSGSLVVVSNTGRVSPQHLTRAASFSGSPANGSMLTHYAKESSRQLAAGMVTLGDIGYKKLSRYYSELRPEFKSSPRLGSPSWKTNGTVNGHLPDSDNVGMVIVRDMVSKSVISQFRAHRSPISALCFDPSGTLLVTASIHGHNINVFRIMPSLSSGYDSGESYVHLYKLQRGITNAVIQDISFSVDGQCIMISSSKGTNHLFAIPPSGGTSSLPSSDASFTHRVKGSGLSTKLEVSEPPSSGSPVLSHQNLSQSGPPVTLSAFCRIRNGSNGWRGTISGAAAAATGRVSSFSGVIATSFHNCNCKDVNANASSLRMKYHMLIFSPSGCLIQYVLRLSNGSNSEGIVSELTTAYESSIDCDEKLVIEPLQKWDICLRQSRREREDNVDIYGEHGNGDSTKVFPEMTRGTSMNAANGGTIRKAKTISEENHLYISEAELQMHHSRIPLWAKSQVYFHSMTKDCIKAENLSSLGGEIEIERLPTHMIEAKSKHLVPAFDYDKSPKYQQSRRSRPLQHQESALYEDKILSCRSNSSSLDCLSEGGSSMAELQNGLAENGWGGFQMPTESAEGFVNNRDSPKIMTPLEFVNNSESHLKFVNTSQESVKMENHFKDDTS